MIELLILHELSKNILTMYGISKEIRSSFSVLTTPSYGTIKPALKRLAAAGFIKTQKAITKGGRPSTYYSITDGGLNELKRLLLLPPLENPIQFLPTARAKLACAEILDNDERHKLFNNLKLKCEEIAADTKNILETQNPEFYTRMVFDNLICEYRNFTLLLEGLERACKN